MTKGSKCDIINKLFRIMSKFSAMTVKQTITITNRAFSLVELSVVIVVLSIILTISVTKSTDVINNHKTRVTAEKLQIINQALVAYAALNGSLPAPATFDAGTGEAIGNLGAVSTAEGKVYAETLGTGRKLLIGAIPTKNLGLAVDYLVDGWGNYFSYRVLSPYAFRSETSSCPAEYNHFGCTSIFLDADQGLVVNSGSNSINNNVVYAVISHGANGRSAFSPQNQGRQNLAATANAEIANSLTCSNNTCSLGSDITTVDTYSESFDDVVIFKDRFTLLLELELKTLPCREVREGATVFNYAPGSIITLKSDTAKQYLYNTNGRSCPSGYTLTAIDNTPDTDMKLQCSNYGLWKRIAVVCKP